MSIVQTTARVTRVRDLSPTAREITFTPERTLGFEAGAFVNVFVTVDGREHRRAFSFSSDPRVQEEFTLTIRHVPDGVVSPYFWQSDVVGHSVKLMGPLGRNTADKLQKERVFLLAFGVGVSVIKALAQRLVVRSDLTELTIVTGNRSEAEVLYRDFFEDLASRDARVSFRFVVSSPQDPAVCERVGLIPQHLDGYDFTQSDVYICGQTSACNALRTEIERDLCKDTTSFFVEAF